MELFLNINNKNIRIVKCRDCKEIYIFSKQDVYRDFVPYFCPFCWRKRKHKEELKEQKRQEVLRIKEAEKEKTLYERKIKNYTVIDIDDIRIDDDSTLLVIGNGFDIMHGVKSSYYNFRDSMGKHNRLRTTLEEYIDTEDLWADFEYSLSRIDVSRMANRAAVDTMLDIFDGYDPYESAASFFGAIDSVAIPMDIISGELPVKFNKWVKTLSLGTDDRPFKRLINNPYVLCFNYTEFIETAYDAAREKICYIHGSRNTPKDTLILGHLEGASDDMYEFNDNEYSSPYNPIIDLAQEFAVNKIVDDDKSLTKFCKEIISWHKEFFDKLEDIKKVIVIGHSLSNVDIDYFKKIIEVNRNESDISWCFSCYGLKDLESIDNFVNILDIDKSKTTVFRTDIIKVKITNKESVKAINKPKEKLLCKSKSNGRIVTTTDRRLYIKDKSGQVVLYNIFFKPINLAFFDDTEKFLFIRTKGSKSGFFIYKIENGKWKIVDELSSAGVSLFSHNLRNVFLNDNTLTFVYNNRIKQYSVSTGQLISNVKKRNARLLSFDGEDISRKMGVKSF